MFMEIDVKKSGSNELHFVLKGERHTFPNLLRETLLKDSSVEFAAYKLTHPLDKSAEFIVRTKGKTAKKAIQDSLKKIGKQVSEFEKAFKAAK